MRIVTRVCPLKPAGITKSKTLHPATRWFFVCFFFTIDYVFENQNILDLSEYIHENREVADRGQFNCLKQFTAFIIITYYIPITYTDGRRLTIKYN